jgi:eukaryotic-like serine/threonine-protein kinase
MSHVYRAFDTVIGRPVAVKILTETAAQDRECRERFSAEAHMAAKATHENVISIYDFGTDDEKGLFMVMEFLQGEDLRNAIRHGRTGDLAKQLKIALQIARALEFVHRNGITHRDVKPENIHISTEGVVKLMDFGIAKSEGLNLTRPGYVLGTAYYMAPEQVRGEVATPQVDVYAFGVMLFEILTGRKPFAADSVNQIFYSILNVPVDVAPLQAQGIPKGVADLVVRCTAKNAADRPRGFGPVRADLERLIAELEDKTEALPVYRPERELASSKSRRSWIVGAIAAGVVCIAGTGYFLFRPLPSKITTPTGVMVLVPAGEFQFGGEKQPISLPAFYIDQTEVTNEAYAKFCQATGRPFSPVNGPEFPVSSVTIAEAREFAKWAGKKLPSEFQWEKAARGTDGRRFPWGDKTDASRANIGSDSARPAADFSAGASPFGVLQMVGNLWEFIDKIRPPGRDDPKRFNARPEDPWYMIRGQSFSQPAIAATVLTESAAVPAHWKARDIGFRCVKDAQ